LNWFERLHYLNIKVPGDVIHRTSDRHGDIFVFDDMDYRMLNFNSPFEQSSMSLSHPYRLTHTYTQLMILVLAYIQPNHISLLGLGGGSLLRTLHKVLPECFFTVIELREQVLAVAKEYFFIPIDKRVNFIINDAIIEIKKTKKACSDIIFSDLFGPYNVVPAQAQYSFLKECYRTLTSNGWLVMNFHKLPDNEDIFLRKLRLIFPTVIIGSEAGHFIIFASKSKASLLTTNTDRIESIEEHTQQDLLSLLLQLKHCSL